MKKIYIVCIIIFLLLFFIFYYKNRKLGNTIIKLKNEKIIENILTGKFNYEANARIKVYSNKNENEYLLKMRENEGETLLEGIGKNSISGLKIEKKNHDLVIKNTNLKLEKIYEDYQEIMDNSLFLSTFMNDYQKTEKQEQEENEKQIIIKIQLKDGNKYIKYKELYLEKETGIPSKLVIKNSNHEVKIIIEYTSIKVL